MSTDTLDAGGPTFTRIVGLDGRCTDSCAGEAPSVGDSLLEPILYSLAPSEPSYSSLSQGTGSLGFAPAQEPSPYGLRMMGL